MNPLINPLPSSATSSTFPAHHPSNLRTENVVGSNGAFSSSPGSGMVQPTSSAHSPSSGHGLGHQGGISSAGGGAPGGSSGGVANHSTHTPSSSSPMSSLHAQGPPVYLQGQAHGQPPYTSSHSSTVSSAQHGQASYAQHHPYQGAGGAAYGAVNAYPLPHHTQVNPQAHGHATHPGSSLGAGQGQGSGSNTIHHPHPHHTSHAGGPSQPPPNILASLSSSGLTNQSSSHAYRQYLTDLSTSLFSFVLPLLPTTEELATKEEVRVLIERLIKTIEPSSRLLSFGSSCNSFGLRNSDMDLVCLIDNKEAALHASDLVAMIGDLLERETNFEVKPLPKARIPIIKLTLNPSPGLPFGIACDIGFENRLALENTRLLLTYATIDPARIRTLVLFLKVWSKRRKINSPYRGTLSSYGFTLMVIFYLVHVKNPPVLPNLQRIAPLRPMTKEEVTLEGRDVWFFDDTEMLRKEWSSANFESVGELLIDFFKFYSHDFQYNNTVISIRGGHLTKESKGWMNDIDVGGLNENARDRNRLCIEDPFETPYNVARTVTKDGLYTIRGEFMRATRILTGRPERAVMALAELCLEREDELARAPRSASPAPRNVPSGRSPFALGGGWRNHMGGPAYDRLSPTLNGFLGQGDAEEMGRRAYPSHVPGRRGRQSEPGDMRQYSAQEIWLANQNLGLDFQLPPPMSNGRPIGFGDYLRGRDTSQRGLEPQPMGFVPPRRAGSVHEGITSSAGGSGSASAPISPVRATGSVHSEASYRGSNGTWSTGPSPRPSQSARLPQMDSRGYGGNGFQQRRPSGSANHRGGYDARPLFQQGNGPRFQPQNFVTSGVSSRRAYSAGPSNQNGFTQGGQDMQTMSMTTAPNGGNPASALPPFQPFATSPSDPSNMPHSLNQGSEPSFISPSALLSPEAHTNAALATSTPYPAYQAQQSQRSAPGSTMHSRHSSANAHLGVQDSHLDDLATGMSKVALGLEGTGEVEQVLEVVREESPKELRMPMSAGLPPKPAAEPVQTLSRKKSA